MKIESRELMNVVWNRYDVALERKTKIVEIIRSLDLPNNPLDDIIDQVVNTCLINSLALKNICFSLWLTR